MAFRNIRDDAPSPYGMSSIAAQGGEGNQKAKSTFNRRINSKFQLNVKNEYFLVLLLKDEKCTSQGNKNLLLG